MYIILVFFLTYKFILSFVSLYFYSNFFLTNKTSMKTQ